MSRSLGDRLPADLVRSLSGDRPDLAGHAIVIATTDGAGRPHPALLAYDELLALDPGTLRLATYARSSTAENLRQRGALTLCFVEPGSAHYVKARARERTSTLRGRAVFEATVEDVRADEPDASREGTAEILSGITFRTADPRHRARDAEDVQAALRGAGR